LLRFPQTRAKTPLGPALGPRLIIGQVHLPDRMPLLLNGDLHVWPRAAYAALKESRLPRPSSFADDATVARSLYAASAETWSIQSDVERHREPRWPMIYSRDPSITGSQGTTLIGRRLTRKSEDVGPPSRPKATQLWHIDQTDPCSRGILSSQAIVSAAGDMGVTVMALIRIHPQRRVSTEARGNAVWEGNKYRSASKIGTSPIPLNLTGRPRV